MTPAKKKQGKARPARAGRTAGPASAGGSRAAVNQFYANALAIELEASARYRILASEMQAGDNTRTAELFLKLAKLESGHAGKLRKLAAAPGMLPRARQRVRSQAGQTEVPNYRFLYRRVPPHHALIMALESERRAKAYFERIRANTRDAKIKKLAAQFARDEDQHVAWLEEALAKEPQPAAPFDEIL